MTNVLAEYVARIQAQFPALTVTTARLNRDGMMNDVVIVNQDLVFRFAKTEAAQDLLAYETRLLRVIEQYVSLPIPRIEHQTHNVMHYRLVPGAPLYRHTLLRFDSATQAALACELATFLKQLHAIPLDELPSPPWQTSSESRQQRYANMLAALERAVYPHLWADQKAWINDLFAPVLDGRVDLDAYTPVCLHGDLAAYHILYGAESRHLAGVIDYGTVGAGDAAVDWACLINTYGEHFVRLMHRHYPIAPATIDRARFLAGALELEWALNGIQSNDLSLLLVHLGRARNSQPMLTGWL